MSEESEELQELKAKLRAAEVNFERQLQKEEKEMIKERDAQLEKEENNMEAAKEAAASMEAQAADAKMPDVSDIVGPPPP